MTRLGGALNNLVLVVGVPVPARRVGTSGLQCLYETKPFWLYDTWLAVYMSYGPKCFVWKHARKQVILCFLPPPELYCPWLCIVRSLCLALVNALSFHGDPISCLRPSILILYLEVHSELPKPKKWVSINKRDWTEWLHWFLVLQHIAVWFGL